MGGGASHLEDMITETLMLGRAIVAVTFPGMFRIYDFHSKKAPFIKNTTPFSLFDDMDSEEEDEEDGQKDPADYEHLFHVKVGNDVVYLEDVGYVNESGWTALHACCMSYQTVDAAIAIIDEMIRLGISLDTKTITGPGAFNSGWTPLHMACAYGVEPIAKKLIESDANVNTTNSYGCTPLLEACHRGFYNIVMMLVRSTLPWGLW